MMSDNVSLLSNQYVNVKINADTNGKVKNFMHDLLMFTFTEELMVNMKILVIVT